MAEYLCDTDWENRISRLKLNIERCDLMSLKLVYLYEIILLYFASIKVMDPDANIRNKRIIITHLGSVLEISRVMGCSPSVIGILAKYRDYVCHIGAINAHSILSNVDVASVCILFKQFDIDISMNDLLKFKNASSLNALRAI